MRVLCVTPQPPWPPVQGTALRNLHLLRALAGRHEVDLLTFGEPAPGEAAPGDPLRQICRRVECVPLPRRTRTARLRDLALGRADMEGRLWSPAFAARLAELLRDGAYEAVQLEGFEVAGYLLGPAALRAEAHGRAPWGGGRAPLLVFDDHNAEYQLQGSAARIDRATPRRWPRALYSTVQARRLRAREALYAAAADRTLAVSPEDAAALEALVPGLGATVVPNGVDVASLPAARPAREPVLFFAGKLDYRPNVDACEWLVEEILPQVRARRPAVRVVLAGRDPVPVVCGLARAPGVEVTGPLSDDDLARRRAAAWVCVVPMRMGSGVRFKALEAMAAGVPLVATPLGAAGLGATPGEHLLIAADAKAFAGAVLDLLEHPQRRAALAAAARRLAAERHDWARITPRLLALYDDLAHPGRSPVSAVATVRNERASVEALLCSLAGQRRPPDETVVVDGGSEDGTLERLQALAAGDRALGVLPARGANISQGRNRAIAAAGHEVIACTDAGVRLGPEWLPRLVAPLERDPALAGASGFFVAAPQSIWELALGATTLPDVGEVDPARFLPSSRSVAFRRAAWRRAGGYPEWLDYCEDLVFDLALRRVAPPLRFVPRATVHFRPRPTPGAFFRQYYRYARGDGKAGLWPRRHAARYGAYLAGCWLLGLALGHPARRPPALLLLVLGGVAYLRRPFFRLTQANASVGARWRAAPLLPAVRLIGDVAKMLGYPAGLWWRHRR